jgi:hypothetical protein
LAVTLFATSGAVAKPKTATPPVVVERASEGEVALVGRTAAATKPPEKPLTTHEQELIRVLQIVGRGGALTGAQLRAVLGAKMPKEYVEAYADVLAGGRAVEIYVVLEYGGDSASVDGWLVTDVRPLANVPLGTAHVFSADARFLYFTSGGAAVGTLETRRLDLVTGKEISFAPCFAPEVSPGGKWLVCRTKTEGVLRVPIGGGAHEVVDKGTGKIAEDWVPYANVHPAAPSFPTAKTIAFEQRGKLVTRAWNE